MAKLVLGVMAALAVCGGASIAAQHSLPGDALHSVKTSINEPIRVALSFDAQTKADTQTAIAIDRIEEMEKLAVREKIDPAVAAEVVVNFNAHASEANSLLPDLSSDGCFIMSSDFESSLKTHKGELTQLSIKEPEDAKPLLSLVNDINKILGTTTSTRAKAQGEVMADRSPEAQERAEARLDVAEEKIADVKASVANDDDLSPQAKSEANKQIAAAVTDIATGKAKLVAKAYGDALVAFQRACNNADEARLIADLDVRLSVKPSTDASIAAESKLDLADRKIADAKASVAANADITAKAKADANAKIAAAVSAVATGKARLTAKAYADAFASFQKACQNADEARLIIDSAIQNKNILNGGVDVTAMAQAKLSLAESKLADAKAYLAANGAISAQAKADASANIAAAERAILAGKTRLAAKASADAFVQFQTACQDADQAKLSIDSGVQVLLQVPKTPSVPSVPGL